MIYLCNACLKYGVSESWEPYAGEPQELNCVLCGARPAPHAFVATRIQVKDLIKRLGDDRPKSTA